MIQVNDFNKDSSTALEKVPFPSLPQNQLKYFSKLGGKRYSNYLNSLQWHAKKQRFLRSKLYHGRCTCCLQSNVPLKIHHKTYIRLGNERLSDLIALCENCHRISHVRAAKTGNLRKAHRKEKRRLAREYARFLSSSYNKHDWKMAWKEAKSKQIGWGLFCRVFHPIF